MKVKSIVALICLAHIIPIGTFAYVGTEIALKDSIFIAFVPGTSRSTLLYLHLDKEI